MTYRLATPSPAVAPVADGPYRLVDIDLAADPGPGRHVRDAGYWKRPVGSPISGGAKGAHLTAPGEADPVALAKSVESAVSRAAKLEPGSEEHAKAWAEIANNVDALSERVKAAAPKTPKGAWTEKAPVKAAKEGTKGIAEHLTIGGALIPAVIAAGNKITAGAASLLSNGETERFAHAFEEFAHNPIAEAGIWVGLALLLHALAVRLKAALKKRKASKIEKAREGSKS